MNFIARFASLNRLAGVVRTPSNLRFALAALLAALPALPAGATVPMTERSDAVVAVDGVRTLVVENARGRIQVVPSPDGKLHVSAIKTVRVGRQGKVEEYRRETSVSAGREGDTYAIRVRYPKRVDVQIDFWDLFRSHRGDDPFLTRIEVALILEVPKGLSLDAHSVSGDVMSDGVTGAQSISSTSGDVTVRHTAAAVKVSTTSGDVAIDTAGRVVIGTSSGDVDAQHVASIEASSTSGDVQVAGVADSVRVGTSSGDVQVDAAPMGARLHTTSGDITLSHASRSVEASSASGEIVLGVVPPFTRVDASSTSGSVKIQLAGRPDYDVDLSSASGDLSADANLQSSHQGRHSLVGRLGKGGPRIRIRTASGDITVKSEGR